MGKGGTRKRMTRESTKKREVSTEERSAYKETSVLGETRGKNKQQEERKEKGTDVKRERKRREGTKGRNRQ